MKLELRLYLVGILILIFSTSCGQSVKETVKPVIPSPATGQFKNVVILPFADYTADSSVYAHCRRNVLVLEALQDALYQAGFVPAPQEDVVEYLLSRGVIQASTGGSAATASLEQELRENWSDEMKEEIEEQIFQSITNESQGDQKHIAVDSRMLRDFGNVFGADYIVRGRIIEFRLGREDTLNPLKTHLIPFVFKSGKRTIFGITDSDAYEAIDKGAIGGTLRELVGRTDPASSNLFTIDKLFSMEDVESVDALGLGAGGFATGLVERTGRVPKATVQLRVLVQDAGTGKLMWLNRAEVSVTPQTAYAKHDRYALFATAIEEAVKSLVRDFTGALASGTVAGMDMAEPAETEEWVKAAAAERDAAAEARKAACEAKKAALEAKKAACEANKSTQQAEEAAAQATKASGEADKASVKTERIFEKIIAK